MIWQHVKAELGLYKSSATNRNCNQVKTIKCWLKWIQFDGANSVVCEYRWELLYFLFFFYYASQSAITETDTTLYATQCMGKKSLVLQQGQVQMSLSLLWPLKTDSFIQEHLDWEGKGDQKQQGMETSRPRRLAAARGFWQTADKWAQWVTLSFPVSLPLCSQFSPVPPWAAFICCPCLPARIAQPQ